MSSQISSNLAPPSLTSGVTGELARVGVTDVGTNEAGEPRRRSHRRVAAPGAPPFIPSAAFSNAISQLQRDAVSAVREQAVRGELTVAADVSEEQVEEMEVDSALMKESIAKLKQRLNVKMREHEAREAQLKVAHKLVAQRQQQNREQRIAALRQQRALILRQRSEEAAAAASSANSFQAADEESNCDSD